MPPKPPPPCGVCAQTSKYRCSACPVRYCSVKCYKVHKESCVQAGGSAPAPSLDVPKPETTAPESTTAAEASQDTPTSTDKEVEEKSPLRPLTSLRWPPEPDASLFMDPLKRDDPKPLRHAELERIGKSTVPSSVSQQAADELRCVTKYAFLGALVNDVQHSSPEGVTYATSKDLRALLAHPTLPRVLAAIDELPSTNARHAALARVLGVDAQSLAKPAASALMGRESPPPLDELLGGITNASAGRDDWGADGWWLGRENKVWVGPEERRLMRIWAGVVVGAIDGEGEASWGEGALEWEV